MRPRVRSRGVHAVDDALLRRRSLGDHLEKTWSPTAAHPALRPRSGLALAPRTPGLPLTLGIGEPWWWVIPDHPDEDKFSYRVHVLPLACGAIMAAAIVVKLLIGGG